MAIKISSLSAGLAANLTPAAVLPITDSTGTTVKASLAQLQVQLGTGVFNVKAAPYGAKGDGATDDTASIQAAVTAAMVAGGIVYFPAGTYLVSSTITIAAFGVRLVGEGERVSLIKFNPSSPAVCLDWINASSATTLSNCGIYHLGAISSNAIKKTWCRLTDVSSFDYQHVNVFSTWTSAAFDSIGAEFRGRELFKAIGYTFFCDRPMVFSQNPRDGGSLIDCDTFTFREGYLRAAATQVAVYFDPTLRSVQSPTFDGGAIVGGAGGFQWNGAGATLDSSGWVIRNWRSEQMTGSTGWFVDFSRDGFSVVDPIFENIAPAFTQGGFRLRRTTFPFWNTIRWPDVTGTPKLFDVDATVAKLLWLNVFTQVGGAATLTGQTKVWGLSRQNTVDNAISYSAFYDTATNGCVELGNIVRWTASSRMMLPSDALLLVDSTNSTILAQIQPGGRFDLTNGCKVGTGTAVTNIQTYTPTLTPASVAATTVAEQTFTVTGLTTADKVIVNAPAIGNSTGIAGARVSAADTLAIRFVNPTAGALTPSSGTYTVVAIRS